MAGKASPSKKSIPSTANKDLSCLRCRKKKAKCSKTRPTCTRCARSNQPCEYPDAPPNLTDLSQKVLTLYDTLRELEGEFLEKYMQEIDTPIPPKQQKQQDDFTPSTEEPAGWSMSLGEHGLSLHIIARNGHEYNEFTKSLSHQLARDFGPEFLPTVWDMEEDDEEELDEDEYLVTIPVCSTQCLFPLVEPKRHTSILTKEDTLSRIIQSQLPTMLQHLVIRYASLQESDDHLSKLMLHLKLYLPLSNVYCPTTQTVGDLLSTVFIITAYVVSVALLPSLPDLVCPPLPNCVWQDCADYATSLLMDLVLDQGDQLSSYPVILCTLLLAWIHTELVSSSSPQALIGLAIRLLILSDNNEQTSPWQALMAALIYLDVYSALFYAQTLQLNALWPLFQKPKDKESQWMLLLAQVMSLFYDPYTSHVRKVDVDEVLTLVRDMEIQEQTLSNQKQSIQIVHYMIKILLFRPFCVHGEQTLTKSTFLDLSTSAADALSQLLVKEHTPWSKGALLLVQDVLDRVSAEFQDKDTQAQLDKIKRRL